MRVKASGLSMLILVSALGAQTPTARPSGELQIIESKAPSLPAARAWRVDEKPLLVLGDPTAPTEGDSLYEFTRVLGITRLASGEWVIANATNLRFYDASGRYVRTAGRSGAGPGEFRQLMGLKRARGDTLVVTDQGEVEYFTPDGKFIAQGASRRSNAGTFIYPEAVLPDGSYLGISWNEPNTTLTGRWMRRLPLMRVSRDGQRKDTLQVVPATEAVGTGRAGLPLRPTYAANAMTAASGARIFHASPAAAEVREFTESGKEVRISRLDIRARAVTSADKDDYRRWMLDGAKGEDGKPIPPQLRAQREQMLDLMGFAESFPIHDLMLADPTANVWLRRFEVRHTRYKPGAISTPTYDAPDSWDVIGANGRWLCTVTLPANFTPVEIGSDYVVGVARNADDVEMIKVLRLLKP